MLACLQVKREGRLSTAAVEQGSTQNVSKGCRVPDRLYQSAGTSALKRFKGKLKSGYVRRGCQWWSLVRASPRFGPDAGSIL